MTELEKAPFEHMCAVTISREYGSGGGEIARRLAARLGWQLIDHDIVRRMAQELHISEREVQEHDEQTDGMLARLVSAMQDIDITPFVLTTPPVVHLALNRLAYHEALTKVITAAAAKRHIVIVGRASQLLLAKQRDVLHVRIVAPLELRIAYVMNRENLNKEQALARIQSKERDRSRYLQAEFQQHPDDAHLYDLVVNTAVLSLDCVVELLCHALQYKATQLSTPQEKLGPGVGLTPYPGTLEDFEIPEAD